MSANKFRMPGNASRGRQAMRFTTSNPFAALDAVMEQQSDGSGSSGPASLSDGSMSQNSYPTAALAAPTRGPVYGGPPLGGQHLNLNGMSPQQPRRMTADGNNGYAIPAQRSMATVTDYNGSPQRMAMPGRPNFNHQFTGSPQGVAMGQRRDSNIDHSSPTAHCGSHMAANSSSSRASSMSQVPSASSLTGIPPLLAVQELAYRQGQKDHGVFQDRVPASPFAKQFDQVWSEFYALGKACGGKPISPSNVDSSSGHQNFPWPILINPYTQDLEHPNGSIDAEYARKMCIMALNCMAALIGMVCRRQGEWQKTICDVPAQIRHALMGFEDLRNRYETLKRDAEEARCGGRPYGY